VSLRAVGVGLQLLMTLDLTYEITQCYLPPDTSEHTPP